MKLLSGHEVCELTDEENEKQKEFLAYNEIGLVTLQPGNWFFTKSFPKYADNIYQFEYRSDDIVIMTYPKCGTTWAQEIVWTIVNNPDLDNPAANASMHIRSPFIEFDLLTDNPYMQKFVDAGAKPPMLGEFMELCPGKDPKDGIMLQMMNVMKERRILKAHNPFSLLHPKLLDTCKVVYVVRNPKDVCVSFYHHSKLFRGHDYVGSLESFIDVFISDKVIWSPFWTHLKESWAKRSHPNLLFVFYEDLKSNPKEQINRIANFIGNPLSDKQLQNIVDYTSFASMKSRSEEIGILPDIFCNKKVAEIDGGFFRKGEIADGKEMTPDMHKKMDAWIKANTQDMSNDFKYKPKKISSNQPKRYR